ncbi:MAG: hypothetical protein ACC631_11015, partial [Halocynthiibacter sp.]
MRAHLLTPTVHQLKDSSAIGAIDEGTRRKLAGRTNRLGVHPNLLRIDAPSRSISQEQKIQPVTNGPRPPFAVYADVAVRLSHCWRSNAA